MVLPEDYASDNPPERIIGVECEYNIQKNHDYSINDYIGPLAITAAGLRYYGMFLSNGGGLYVDVGHLEYDTPECLGPRQAAAADMAGILVMQRIVEGSGFDHNGVYRITGSFKPSEISGNNSGSKTNGYHENFQIPEAIIYDPLIDQLMPAYLASRVLAMNGMVRNSYVFSQKVWGIGGHPVTRNVDRRTDHGNKPMAMIPPVDWDDTMGGNGWARLEVRHADAGLSPDARYLSFAATSLVLRLVEHQDKFPKKHPIKKLQFRDPVHAAYMFAEDLTLQRTAETTDGKQLTAANTQEILADAAYELCEMIELPDSEKRIPKIWGTVYQRLKETDPAEAEYGSLRARFDIAAKHPYLARRFERDEMNANNAAAQQASLDWDKILPEGGGVRWFKENKPVLVDMAEVERLTKEAPLTRAARRAAMITDPSLTLKSMTWSATKEKNGRLTDMSDAYAYQ